jgi:hypothetical protein
MINFELENLKKFEKKMKGIVNELGFELGFATGCHQLW